jgi:hypothetical protein
LVLLHVSLAGILTAVTQHTLMNVTAMSWTSFVQLLTHPIQGFQWLVVEGQPLRQIIGLGAAYLGEMRI